MHAAEIVVRNIEAHSCRVVFDFFAKAVGYPKAKGPLLQEVFYLDEGPVTLSFPSDLSLESFKELKDGLEFALRRAQRRSRQPKNDPGEN